jgi:hypothetical protein
VEINIQQNRDNLEVDNASLFLWFGFSFGMSHLALTRKLIGTSGRRSKSFVRIQRSSVWVISSARSAQTAQWLGTIKRMLHSIATVCDRGGADRGNRAATRLCGETQTTTTDGGCFFCAWSLILRPRERERWQTSL